MAKDFEFDPDIEEILAHRMLVYREDGMKAAVDSMVKIPFIVDLSEDNVKEIVAAAKSMIARLTDFETVLEAVAIRSKRIANTVKDESNSFPDALEVVKNRIAVLSAAAVIVARVGIPPPGIDAYNDYLKDQEDG